MSRSTNNHNAYCNQCFHLWKASKFDLKHRVEGKTRLGTPIVVCQKHAEKKKKRHNDLPGQKRLDFGS